MPERFDDLQSDHDVERILSIAMTQQGAGSSLEERLRLSARELGISDADLAAAATRWREQNERETFERDFRIEKQRELINTITGNGTAAGVCLVVNFVMQRAFTWSLLVAGILGVVVLFKLIGAGSQKPTERDFDRWRRRRRREQEVA